MLAEMELVNRHYVMTRILGGTKAIDYFKLALLELFGVTTPLISPSAWSRLPAIVVGKVRGAIRILGGSRDEGTFIEESSLPTTPTAISTNSPSSGLR